MAARPRKVTSGAAAFAVVIVLVFVWWLLSGNGPQGPGGNDDRLAVPPDDATAPVGGSSGPQGVRPGGVRVDSFVLERGSRLALNYTTGPPACVGEVDTPRVVETDAAVTVTLTLVPPPTPSGPCAEIAMLGTVRVDLDVPLGDRSLLDGSFARPVRVEPTSTAYEQAP